MIICSRIDFINLWKGVKDCNLFLQSVQEHLIKDIASIDLFVFGKVSKPLLLDLCHVDQIALGSSYHQSPSFDYVASLFSDLRCHSPKYVEKIWRDQVNHSLRQSSQFLVCWHNLAQLPTLVPYVSLNYLLIRITNCLNKILIRPKTVSP